jgi:hypothetical protein
MLAGLRPEPAFAAIRAAAIECQNKFLTLRPGWSALDGLQHDRRIRGVGNGQQPSCNQSQSKASEIVRLAGFLLCDI